MFATAVDPRPKTFDSCGPTVRKSLRLLRMFFTSSDTFRRSVASGLGTMLERKSVRSTFPRKGAPKINACLYKLRVLVHWHDLARSGSF